MLSSVYLDAVRKRDTTLLALQDSTYEDIIEKAKTGWTEYSPSKADSRIIGVDASYNSIKYQGLDLWVVTAVAVGADNSVVFEMHDNGLGLVKNSLSLMANNMEVKACKGALGNADLILMDGSIHSKTLKDKDDTRIPKLFLENQNIVFVSKSSDATDEFGKFGSKAGDIFYYSHASRKAGYSRIQTWCRIHCLFLSTTIRISDMNTHDAVYVAAHLHSHEFQVLLQESLDQGALDLS